MTVAHEAGVPSQRQGATREQEIAPLAERPAGAARHQQRHGPHRNGVGAPRGNKGKKKDESAEDDARDGRNGSHHAAE